MSRDLYCSFLQPYNFQDQNIQYFVGLFLLWFSWASLAFGQSIVNKNCDMLTLPQIGVNPTSLQLLVFQHFWSFVTEIRSPILANKFYKGGFFVNLIHFCCITNYQSISLIHHGIIALPSLDIFLTKCDQEKHFWAA